MKYYSLKRILAEKAQYNMVIGERSNGKTYSVLYYGIENYCKDGSQLAIVRRWQDDFRGKRGATMFDALVNNDVVRKLTKGEWTNVYSYSGRWYFCKYDENAKRIVAEEPFAYGFALSAMEHDKSTSYPRITTILFDEFLTRGTYLPDEFVMLTNVLSTIIRQRDNVKIFMMGNTVNQYSPYFAEMGLTRVKDMKPGTIDVYQYGEEGKLRVAVEYAEASKEGKKSDVYFAFDNPKLKMITTGVWEIDIYPHCPYKYKPKDIQFTYFIKFGGDTLQCEVVLFNNTTFTFIHRKTTDIKYEDFDIIFSPEYDPRPNWRRKITKPTCDLERKLLAYFVKDKVFYQDNEVGEIVRNYLIWSKGGEK